MTTWFTSDTHFSHQNIIRYCDRPFSDTDEMDEAIIRNWNELVSPEDTVYHLGDVALGPIEKSLAKVGRLNGFIYLKTGNHDRPFMRYGKADEQKWWKEYQKVFDVVIDWDGASYVRLGDTEVAISHFPFTGDHTPTDRHSEWRPVDRGTPLIHGHTHTPDRLTFSANGTPQIHVGMDAWDFRPVHESDVLHLLDTAS